MAKTYNHNAKKIMYRIFITQKASYTGFLRRSYHHLEVAVYRVCYSACLKWQRKQKISPLVRLDLELCARCFGIYTTFDQQSMLMFTVRHLHNCAETSSAAHRGIALMHDNVRLHTANGNNLSNPIQPRPVARSCTPMYV